VPKAKKSPGQANATAANVGQLVDDAKLLVEMLKPYLCTSIIDVRVMRGLGVV